MKKTELLGVLALCAASFMAHADEAPLRIGIEAAYPPFSFRTPEGQVSGFDYDIGAVSGDSASESLILPKSATKAQLMCRKCAMISVSI